MAHLDAYLFFDGTCAEAMRFYERVLRGKLEFMQTYGESPAAGDVAPERHGRVMHARLVIDGRALMASDAVTTAWARPSPSAAPGPVSGTRTPTVSTPS